MADEKIAERPKLPPVVQTTGQTSVIVSGRLKVTCDNPSVKIERSD